MFNKVILPLLAIAGLAFGIKTVIQYRQVAPAAKPYIEPPNRSDPSTLR